MKKDWNQSFDNKLREELNRSVENTFPSDSLKDKIDSEIKNLDRNSGRGEFKMKKSKIGVVLAAAVVLCGGVFAIGKSTGIISSSSSFYNYTSYEDTTKAEKKAGFDAIIPEKLGEYKFDGIRIVDLADVDEDNNEQNKRKSVSVDYKNENNDIVTLDTDKLQQVHEELVENEYQEIREYNGVKFYYFQLHNLFLASEDDMTPEERERKENDPFFNVGIGGSSQEREECITNHIIFDIDGIRYEIMASEKVDANELFEMGQEFVK
ncbi:hypothetical protein [Peptoniphilus sp.]|jgi:hypothetical protein|uniref:hypothetical protein n=1 Tax=Peptoniphilus sp. TaxID=1971214 RepID=UPI003D9375D1